MLTERIGQVRSWLRQELAQQKEFNRFHNFFRQMRLPDGVLVKPGEELNPIMRGFVTAKGSLGLMNKVIEWKELSQKERKRVREAAWLKSLTGTYKLQHLQEGVVETQILVENDEAMNYLSEHASKETMVAFLSYRDEKHYRYIESQSVGILQEDGVSRLTFIFPETGEVPDENREIYIYTRPIDNKKNDGRFLRLYFMLGF